MLEFERVFDEGDRARAEALALSQLGNEDAHASALVILAQCAVGTGDRESAVRWADRAHRLSPDTQSIACLLAALHLAAGDTTRAISVLSAFEEADLSPEAAITLCHALASAGRVDDARGGCERALARFPVCRTPNLAALLNRVVTLSKAPGWAAVDLEGRLVGAVRPPGPDEPSARLRVRVDAGGQPILDLPVAEAIERFARGPADDGLIPIAVALTRSAEGPLLVARDGIPLVGSGRVRPHRFEVEGDATLVDDTLEGWAWLPALPQVHLTIRVRDQHGSSLTVTADRYDEVLHRAGAGNGRYRFSVDLGRTELRPGRLEVTAEAAALPLKTGDLTGGSILWIDRADGFKQIVRMADALANGGNPSGLIAEASRQCVAGLLRRIPAPVAPEAARRADPAGRRARAIDIVIPVYRGLIETMACIRAVLETVGTQAHVVVIDDASPDDELSGALAALAERGLIELLVNRHNLGFPGSANRGLALHPGRDVVLLNSDALVHGDWLARLQEAAYSAADIGTATPLSNDAEILSYPSGPAGRSALTATDVAAFDALARQCNGSVRIEIPTAVGFCTYIRHDCLAETGLLDTSLFGRGYGEENDFSMRARRMGWRHVAAADVFVGHVGGRSFGRRKAVLTRHNLRTVNRLHPGYEDLIRRFRTQDPLAAVRRRMDLARWRAVADPRPAVLLVAFGRVGGVARHVEERVRTLSDAGRRVLLLTPEPGINRAVRHCRVSDPQQPRINDLLFRTAEEFDLLVDFLGTVPITEIEIQHCLDHDPVVLTLPARLGVPYEVFIHDYIWICPQVCLIDATNRYCGEPDLSACERCVQGSPPASGETLPVSDLRARSRDLLRAARRVVVPVHDVADRLTRHLGDLPIDVVPWDDVRPRALPPHRPAAGRWRVCVIGAIGHHKGYSVLLECAYDAMRRDLPLEFVVVGYSRDDAALFATGRVFVSGKYVEDEAVDLVRRQAAHLAFLPSACPETWSYALSTAWRAGLEAVAFDLGAIAERIRTHGGGRLLPPDMPARAINDRLLAILSAPIVGATPSSAGRSAAPRSSRGSTSMFPSVMNQTTPERPLGAVARVLSLQPGLYSFSVVRGGDARAHRESTLPLPSIALAPAPACAANVEMMGVGACGWLSSQGDTLIVKVSGSPADMVLTSFQPQGYQGQALSIQMTRLDGTPGQILPVGAAAPEIRLRLVAHVQNCGDVTAHGGEWVGSTDRKLWIEGLSITPLDNVPADSVEYKGLNAKGVETLWMTGGSFCGSRGEGTPLIGLAVRLRGPLADRFDCLYEVACLSGARSPVLANGRPYRSDAIGDPIQAFTVRIVPRGTAIAQVRP
ncbi:glycosyltransferase [Azospirillum halopraeferens]|uniref:glycosyltransferase n=1 Tax=Azospirillum halopraeferens TaxID=34010 RepID=UPI00042582F8|nr:glycosyltransferase [Azospirillum halopraeferens]